MADFNEINDALRILKKNKYFKKNLYLMHCHSEYPSELKNVNMLVMPKLNKRFKVKVGYSDHTLKNSVSISAVSLGASVIEKHFTLSKKMRGPDHKASLDPQELKKFVNDLIETQTLLGKSKKIVSKIELLNKKKVRKSIVAKIPITKGEKFSERNIICKRPEGGISPKNWTQVIGKVAKRNFKKDQYINLY